MLFRSYVMMQELGVMINSIGVSKSMNYLEVHLYIKQHTRMIANHVFGEACKTLVTIMLAIVFVMCVWSEWDLDIRKCTDHDTMCVLLQQSDVTAARQYKVNENATTQRRPC